MAKISTLIVSLILGFSGPPVPIKGKLKEQNFHYIHISRWDDGAIINTIENKHDNLLRVKWPKAGIYRENRGIPEDGKVYNSFGCPLSELGSDYKAKLFYGQSSTPKTAGVYLIKDGGNKDSRSTIYHDTEKDGPFVLNIRTRLIEDKISYDISQNKLFDLAILLPLDVIKSFEERGWKGIGSPNKFVKGLPSIPQLDRFILLRPSAKNSTIVVSIGEKPRIRPFLVLISSRENGEFVGSGIITLHVR